MKRRLLTVRCKTEGCATDLKVGEVPPDDADRGVYHVPQKNILTPLRLVCPQCRQTHGYGSEDVETKVVN